MEVKSNFFVLLRVFQLQSWKPNTYQLFKKTSSWWQLHLDPGTWESVCQVDRVYLITEELCEKSGNAKYICTIFLFFC